MKNTLKVLVVDDNIGDFQLLRIAADTLPYDVKFTHMINGVELVSTKDDNPLDHFNFILLDLNMPVVDGVKVLRHYKRNPQIDHPPIIILSGSVNREEIKQCYALGASAFIHKALDMLEFEKSIHYTFNFWGKLNVSA